MLEEELELLKKEIKHRIDVLEKVLSLAEEGKIEEMLGMLLLAKLNEEKPDEPIKLSKFQQKVNEMKEKNGKG